MKKIEKEFEQIRAFIASSCNRAAGFMNYAAVATYWTIGAYVEKNVLHLPNAKSKSNGGMA